MQHMRDFALSSIEQDLKQGIAEGFFRTKLDVEVIARVRLKQIETGFDNQLFPPERYSLARVQTEMLDHFVRGIVTEEGRALYEKLYAEMITQPPNSTVK